MASPVEFESINAVILTHNPDLAKITKNIKQEDGKIDFKIAGTVCPYFLQEYEVSILEQLYVLH